MRPPVPCAYEVQSSPFERGTPLNRINRRTRLTRYPLLIVLALLALVGLLVAKAAEAAEEYLPPEQAFQLTGRMVDAQTLELSYRIADGYYMYRDRFHFSAEGATLGEPQFPVGKRKYDDNFQKEVETYHQSVTARIPVSGAVKEFAVSARYRWHCRRAQGRQAVEHPLAVLPAGHRIVLYALRVADAAHPVLHHHRPAAGRRRRTRAQLPAVGRLFAGHGAGLHGTGRGRRDAGRGLVGLSPEPLGAGCVCRVDGRPGVVDVRPLHPASPRFAAIQIIHSLRRRQWQMDRRLPDGRDFGADRGPLRGGSPGRGSAVHQPDRQCGAGGLCPVFHGTGHERATAAGWRVRRCPAAARRCLDGCGQALLWRIDAGHGLVDGVAGDSFVAAGGWLGGAGHRLWCFPAVDASGWLDVPGTGPGGGHAGLAATGQRGHRRARSAGAALASARPVSRRAAHRLRAHPLQR
ncbi:hypothetical protein Lal_00006976 [Lupinus albus]|nr:hypothetical protein Lal_00006976 [Lupinus albus]